MPTEKRILVATDIPFWRAATGAQQRIDSLVRWQISRGYQVRVFLLGDAPTLTASDQDQVAARSLDVDYRSSHAPPRAFLARCSWYLDSIRNQWSLGTKLGLPSATGGPAPPKPLRLADFRWPWAIRAFGEAIREFEPDAVLIEYVKLAYLLEGIPASRRDDLCRVLDTHDVMHLRHEQFQQFGHPHWLEISREEEIEALRGFDYLLAIQPAEAALFQRLLPNQRTILCGHHCQDARFTPGPFLTSTATMTRPVIGYLASRNASNSAAIGKFLDQVWVDRPDSNLPQRMDLLIAGEVGEDLTERQRQKCRVIGPVDDLTSFYKQVDVVINPVEFGTGLKIKSVEAISYGKPIVTTIQGSHGLPRHSAAIEICESIADFSEPLARWCGPSCLRAATEQARQVAATDFSQEVAYGQFDQVFADRRS